MTDSRNFEEPGRPAVLDSVSSVPARPMTRIDAHALLGNAREVILVLNGSEYRLRLTSKGKLILTK